ncbi:hypothetical protein [Couchioplanes caeruleus]|uniref:hypothetical protein n=1 Tax=Couchioplanes caeruleus TaxID=56438 RepID=UPI0011604C93|nr:hypothetical protein [Couchioplanes caeruleus]
MSAIGLEEHERRLWPQLRERLREPGHMMALMRGALGGDVEVAAVVAVTPQGRVRPLAVLATPQEIVQEIRLVDDLRDSDGAGQDGPRRAKIGDYDVEILLDEGVDGPPRPLAILANPWIDQHLLLFARTLWRRR